MSLTARDVAEILRLLEESSFDELELEAGDIKLSLRRGAEGAAPAPKRAARPAKAAAAAEPVRTAAPKPSAAASANGAVEVPSPLLGVYYRAPKPGQAPFIEVGSKVEAETVIGIIEVMKLMNSVRAGVRGEVVEILAQNAALVEYGETLIRVRPAE